MQSNLSEKTKQSIFHEVRSPDPTNAALTRLREWVEVRDYAGYDPYDILNAKRLPDVFRRRLFDWVLIQTTKRVPSNVFRRILAVPPSKNPKALGLFLSGYCDLARCGIETFDRAAYLKNELKRLHSPNEKYFCWGYDWDYVSLRGSNMRAFRPNSIASVFCGMALLDMAEVFHDTEALEMAGSVAQFFVEMLNRPVDTPRHLCFSYTPENETRIFNTSALVGAFLSRVALFHNRMHYMQLARRAIQYLADQQHGDGSWSYGASRRQKWVDNFHTGYNLCAILDYQNASGDTSFHKVLKHGYDFYQREMFTSEGAAKYYDDATYPIDIHACAQALIVFCNCVTVFPGADVRTKQVLRWTLEKMQSPDGSFYYQRHRLWTNRMPYMRWGQAWMFRAMACVHRENMKSFK